MNRSQIWYCTLLLALATPSLAFAAPPPMVEFELVTEPGAALDAPQKWIAMLKDMGFSNLRIRQGERGDKAEIRQIGGDDKPHYSVTGIATSDNVLRLPGANIRLNDKSSLRNWIAKLHDGGQEGVVAKPVMYGLTAKQMLQVHSELKGRVSFDTKDQPTGEIVEKIIGRLDLKIDLDASATEAAKSQELVGNDLQGLSYGTALAAILRPLGYVFVPEKKLGQELRLVVTDSKNVEKPWPVGWEAKDAPGRLVPEYMKQTNAEITDFVLGDALAAIQKRVKLPMVFDYNGLARARVELDQTKVSTKKGKKSYSRVVDEMLRQVKLRCEIRIDEAETPFLWITSSSSLSR